jgi:hypothetical protein
MRFRFGNGNLSLKVCFYVATWCQEYFLVYRHLLLDIRRRLAYSINQD